MGRLSLGPSRGHARLLEEYEARATASRLSPIWLRAAASREVITGPQARCCQLSASRMQAAGALKQHCRATADALPPRTRAGVQLRRQRLLVRRRAEVSIARFAPHETVVKEREHARSASGQRLPLGDHRAAALSASGTGRRWGPGQPFRLEKYEEACARDRKPLLRRAKGSSPSQPTQRALRRSVREPRGAEPSIKRRVVGALSAPSAARPSLLRAVAREGRRSRAWRRS